MNYWKTKEAWCHERQKYGEQTHGFKSSISSCLCSLVSVGLYFADDLLLAHSVSTQQWLNPHWLKKQQNKSTTSRMIMMIAMMIPAIAPVAMPFLRLVGDGGDGVTTSSDNMRKEQFFEKLRK